MRMRMIEGTESVYAGEQMYRQNIAVDSTMDEFQLFDVSRRRCKKGEVCASSPVRSYATQTLGIDPRVVVGISWWSVRTVVSDYASTGKDAMQQRAKDDAVV